jgi:uncharacterized repeat protein (TIGR03803 family)
MVCLSSRVMLAGLVSLAAFAHPAFAQTASESVFYAFPGGSSAQNPLGLILASDGNYYGFGGGYGLGAPGACPSVNCGYIFRLTPSGQYKVLYTFTGGVDGNQATQLLEAGNGNFYGVALGGSNNGDGALFEITPSGTFTTLHSFTGGSDGAYPSPQAMTLASDGNFYGVTTSDGKAGCTSSEDGCGTFFRLTPSGTFTVLYDFQSDQLPTGGLLQAYNGLLYGEMAGGSGYGEVYGISSAGAFSTLYTFPGPTGPIEPSGVLTEYSDGNLYGLVDDSSNEDEIAMYEVSANGAENFVMDITASATLSTPYWVGTDGNLYATAADGDYEGCDGGCGALLSFGEGKENPSISTVYMFMGGSDAALPEGTLQGADGSFYGASYFGGGSMACTNGCGTIYKIAMSPALPPPVQVTFNSSSISVGTPVTASLSVLNAFSLTMQQCYAFQNETPLGRVPGTYSPSTQLYTFSTSFAPTAPGTYKYAVTCGGVESGYATVTVNAYPTTTTLAASPNPVTPPSSDTLTATVKRTGSSATPTGSVTFYYQTTALGSAKLNGSGVATLQASSSGITAGTYAITAKYSGDSSDAASNSSPVNVVVK